MAPRFDQADGRARASGRAPGPSRATVHMRSAARAEGSPVARAKSAVTSRETRGADPRATAARVWVNAKAVSAYARVRRREGRVVVGSTLAVVAGGDEAVLSEAVACASSDDQATRRARRGKGGSRRRRPNTVAVAATTATAAGRQLAASTPLASGGRPIWDVVIALSKSRAVGRTRDGM